MLHLCTSSHLHDRAFSLWPRKSFSVTVLPLHVSFPSVASILQVYLGHGAWDAANLTFQDRPMIFASDDFPSMSSLTTGGTRWPKSMGPNQDSQMILGRSCKARVADSSSCVARFHVDCPCVRKDGTIWRCYVSTRLNIIISISIYICISYIVHSSSSLLDQFTRAGKVLGALWRTSDALCEAKPTHLSLGLFITRPQPAKTHRPTVRWYEIFYTYLSQGSGPSFLCITLLLCRSHWSHHVNPAGGGPCIINCLLRFWCRHSAVEFLMPLSVTRAKRVMGVAVPRSTGRDGCI